MKLTKEQIGAIINAHPEGSNEIYPCPDGGQIHTTCHYQVLLDAQLQALASTPDEELKNEMEKAILEDNKYFNYLGRATARILAKVQPVIATLRAKLAEAEKEKQQAVEQERNKWIKAVNDEPECPGEIPSEMWVAMQARDVATEAMHQSVHFTKQGILERGQALQEGKE